jgi:hypothetical protein
MNELSPPETRFDALLFASLCETDEMTLSVLSLLARQDVDPWQEANRLPQLSGAEAINSSAARIWKSDSEQWSPSEASMLAARLSNCYLHTIFAPPRLGPMAAAG